MSMDITTQDTINFDQAVSVKENFGEKCSMDKFKPFLMMIVYTVTVIILSAPVQSFAQLPTPDYSGRSVDTVNAHRGLGMHAQ